MMQVDYRFDIYAPIDEVFDGRLAKYGINEIVKDGRSSETERCLTDGFDSVWVYGHVSPSPGCSIDYRFDDAPGIYVRLQQLFQTEVLSDNEPQYWGFDSHEDWDNHLAKQAERERNRLYDDLVNFLTLRAHPFQKDTVGMGKALVAHELVVNDPTYLDVRRKSEFLNHVDERIESKTKHYPLSDKVPW